MNLYIEEENTKTKCLPTWVRFCLYYNCYIYNICIKLRVLDIFTLKTY